MSRPETDFKQVFAAILIDRRQALGLTEDDVAAALGITDSAVNRWERAKSYPRAYRFPALAEFLELTVAQLKGQVPLPAEKLIESTFDVPGFAAQVEDLIFSAEQVLASVRKHPAVRKRQRARSKAKKRLRPKAKKKRVKRKGTKNR